MTNPDLAALSEAATQSEPAWNVFAQALVREYRAGRLVLIDEGMRERVWHDYRFQAACHRYAHNGGSSEAIVAAAIAAMMGGAK